MVAPARTPDETAGAGGTVLEVRDVTKRFGAVTAVDGVSLSVATGEVLALVGENGAGKSTLMKLLTGAHQPDEGELRIDGEPTRLAHPADARDRGIAIIHQEFTLLPARTVAQNVFLGREPTRRLGVVDDARMVAETDAVLERLDVGGVIDARQPVEQLSVARQQMVEIAKAVSTEARVLVMDEPTAALSPAESETLFALVEQLRAAGVGVVYITHRLEEVFRLADRVVVLRDGAVVQERRNDETLTEHDVVRAMVGRELDEYYPEPARPEEVGAVRLATRQARNARVGPLDLEVRSGEILGVGGLEGAGQRELADGIFGLEPFTQGQVLVDGRDVTPRGPRAAIASGIGYVTADRKGDGLVLQLSVAVNAELTVRSVGASSRRRGTETPSVEDYLRDLEVRLRSVTQPVGELSGGNQQKVVLTKWLSADADVLVLHEPTRGIDVGSKAAIHDVLRDLARRGLAVMMISSDLPELLGVSDRLLVMREGRIVGELPRGASEHDVMELATGVGADATEVSA